MNENQSNRREGGGPLDSSWLNARAKDTTGDSIRAEVVGEMLEFLRRDGVVPVKKEGVEDGSEDKKDVMQIDT